MFLSYFSNFSGMTENYRQTEYQQQMISNYLLDLPDDVKGYIIKQRRIERISLNFRDKLLRYYAQPNYYLLSVTDEEKFAPRYNRYDSLEEVINEAMGILSYYFLVFIDSSIIYHDKYKPGRVYRNRQMSEEVDRLSLMFYVKHSMSIWSANSTRDASGNRMNANIRILTYDKYTNPNDDEDEDDMFAPINPTFSLYLVNDPADPSIPPIGQDVEETW